MPAVAAACGAVLLYANSLNNPFVYDDYRLIVENPAIQNLTSVLAILVRDITRPLVGLSYALDTSIWGTGPFGYHLTNVLLHALNVVLVYWVGLLAAADWRRRGGGRYGLAPDPTVVAVASSLLAACHPVMTQAVGYVTGRSEVLHSVFFLAALLAARQWMRVGGWWRSIAVAFWFCALLAKETAAVFPLVLVCYDAWLMDGDRAARRRRLLSSYLPAGALVLLFGAGRLAVLATLEYPEESRPDWHFALATLDAFWRYVGLYVWPRNQTIIHTLPFPDGFTPVMVAKLAALLALLASVWWLRRIQALVAFGLLLAVLILVPSSVLFITGIGEPMAEHRAYLSAIGFFLACGAMTGIAWARVQTLGRAPRRAVAAVGILFIVQLAGLTLVRNDVWGSSVGLARESVLLSPAHWMPRLLLAETLRQTGRCGEAVGEYRRVIDIRPRELFPRTKLLQCLLLTGQIRDAEEELKQLRVIDPGSQEASMGLGMLAVARGRAGESRAYFNEVLAAAPDRQDAQQFVRLLDGSLPEPQRAAVCGMVRALVPSTADGASSAVCP
jgi:Flp pilus assembly protein TadD